MARKQEHQLGGRIVLDAGHLAAIDRALRGCHDVEMGLLGMEQCGEECSELRAEMEQARAKLNAFKSHFGTLPKP